MKLEYSSFKQLEYWILSLFFGVDIDSKFKAVDLLLVIVVANGFIWFSCTSTVESWPWLFLCLHWNLLYFTMANYVIANSHVPSFPSSSLKIFSFSFYEILSCTTCFDLAHFIHLPYVRSFLFLMTGRCPTTCSGFIHH